MGVTGAGQFLRDLGELCKLRLSALVLVTVGIGWLQAHPGSVDPLGLALAVLGAALAAFGANALNQWWEREHDRRMCRTRARPLPSGRLTPGLGLAFGLGLLGLGGTLLVWAHNPLAAGLALAAGALYVLVYTPLKRRSPWSIVPGAVVGALPPLLGWAAASGGALAPGAWTLFAILFVWQVPHFLAIDWMHREDYAEAGYRMLSRADPSGRSSARLALVGSLLLFPVGLAPIAAGQGGAATALAATLLAGGMVVLCLGFARELSHVRARRIFLASLVHLPALLGVLALESHLRALS